MRRSSLFLLIFTMIMAVRGADDAPAQATAPNPDREAPETGLYVRIKPKSVEPAADRVAVAGTFFGSHIHHYSSRFELRSDGSVQHWKRKGPVPWQKIWRATDAQPTLREWSEWANLTHFFPTDQADWKASFDRHGPPKVLALSFWVPDGEDPREEDPVHGNVNSYSARVQFASEPTTDALIRDIKYGTEWHSLSLYFKDHFLPIEREAEVGKGIETLVEYAKSRESVYKNRGARTFEWPDRSQMKLTGAEFAGRVSWYSDPKLKSADKPNHDMGGRHPEQFATSGVGPEDLNWTHKLPADNHGLFFVPNDSARPLFREWLSDHEESLTKEGYVDFHDEQNLTRQKRYMGGSNLKSFTDKERSFIRDRFRTWLQENRYGVNTPSEVGAESWDEVTEIFNPSDATTPGEKFRSFLTYWFFQIGHAENHGAFVSAYHDVVGDDVNLYQSIFYGGFTHTPDYFLEGRYGAADQQMHHYGYGDRQPAYPHADFFMADMLRSVTEFSDIEPGTLFFPSRIQYESGTLLAGLSGLASGLYNRENYRYGPGYVGASWDWFSDDRRRVGAFVGANTINRMQARYEDYLIDGERPQARVGIVLSRSAAVFHPDASKYVGNWPDVERRMLHATLRRNGYLTDVVPEENIGFDPGDDFKLSDYDVLYVFDTHLSRPAQRGLLDWVNDGGRLYVGGEAARRDERDQTNPLFHRLASASDALSTGGAVSTSVKASKQYNHEIQLPGRSPVTRMETASGIPGGSDVAVFRRETITASGGETLATYRNGGRAMISAPLGEGRVVKSGVPLGAALAETADPPWQQNRPGTEGPNNPEGGTFKTTLVPHRRTYDAGLQDLILHPVTTTGLYRVIDRTDPQDVKLHPITNEGVERPVTASMRGIDRGFFKMPDGSGALLLLGNRSSASAEELELTVRLDHRYETVETFSGTPVDVSWTGTTVKLSLDMGIVEGIEFQ